MREMNMQSQAEEEESGRMQFEQPNQKEPKSRKPLAKSTIFSTVFSFVKVFIIAVIITFVINQFIIVNAKVPTASMENTIMVKDRLIGFRLAYLFTAPKRGDVVIFKFPDDESKIFVKRVIGTPGDIVIIENGQVSVNGEVLDEPYLKEPMNDNGMREIYCVPKDSYFMLGDNRNISQDSRAWKNTYVARKKILAKAEFIYFDGNVTFEIIH